MRKRPLTAVFVARVTTPGRYGDGGLGGLGLYLRVHRMKSGRVSKSWGQRVRAGGKPTNLGLGSYPVVTLKEAREKALENRRAVHWGHDPRDAGVPTFEAAVENVIVIHSPTWKNPSRIAGQWRQTLRDYAHPRIGRKRVSEVATADVLAILQPIWSSKPAAARVVHQRIGAVMKWAVAKGYRPDNPAGDAIAAALPRNGNATRHHKALPHGEVAAALVKVRDSGSHAGVRLALEFMALTATRSNEVRGATWDRVRSRCLDHSRRPHEGEARAPGSPVGAGLGDPRGSPEAPRRRRDRVPGREGRKDPRLDVQQVAPPSRYRRNAPRDEVLVPRLVLGDGRGARGGGGGACTQGPQSGRGRLRPLGPAGPEARGHAGVGRVSSRTETRRPSPRPLCRLRSAAYPAGSLSSERLASGSPAAVAGSAASRRRGTFGEALATPTRTGLSAFDAFDARPRPPERP